MKECCPFIHRLMSIISCEEMNDKIAQSIKDPTNNRLNSANMVPSEKKNYKPAGYVKSDKEISTGIFRMRKTHGSSLIER